MSDEDREIFKKNQIVFIVVNGWPHDVIIDCAYQTPEGLFYDIKSSKKHKDSHRYPDYRVFKTRDEAIASKEGKDV